MARPLRRLSRAESPRSIARGRPQGATSMNITDWFYDVTPFPRKRTFDWVLPAVAGVGIGLAAGIGIGLLCAPSTGEEARLRLREGASRMKDRAATLAAKARRQIAGVERSAASAPEQLGLGHS
jgi:hypothetical protein